MPRVGLSLIPRDGLFLKDGRGWTTSATGRAFSVPWPRPGTLAGAVRTLWGRMNETPGVVNRSQDWLRIASEVSLGPSIALRRTFESEWSESTRMWPRPADALYLEDATHVHRLEPQPTEDVEMSGPLPTAHADSLWFTEVHDRSKPTDAPDWWDDDSFSDWLAGSTVPVRVSSYARHLALPTRTQVHVSMNERNTATDGGLFSTEVLEFLTTSYEWAICVQAEVPGEFESQERLLTLGGDRRACRVEIADSSVFAFPDGVRSAFGAGPRGLRLVVVTPASFSGGWLPDGFQWDPETRTFRGTLPQVEEDLILRAAIVDRAIAVSGWDMVARKPKRTDLLVPSGSVYFFMKVGDGRFSALEAESLWLSQFGGEQANGLGCVVPGVWEPITARGN